MTAPRDGIAPVVVCETDGDALIELGDRLAAAGYGVLPATGAAEVGRLCRYNQPALLLLGSGLPVDAAVEVIGVVREGEGGGVGHDPGLPIIALGGRDGEDRRHLTDLGADEDLPGPVRLDELMVRIGTTLRRRHNRREEPIRAGEIVVDPGRRVVLVGEREVRLAKKEFLLLCILAGDPTHVFSKEELLHGVWGPNTPVDRLRSLDSHMSRLRAKLDGEGHRYVINCWGVGYSLFSGRGRGLR
jgi:two-component system alkaline phosphatase synthesis response regulator PhoP